MFLIITNVLTLYKSHTYKKHIGSSSFHLLQGSIYDVEYKLFRLNLTWDDSSSAEKIKDLSLMIHELQNAERYHSDITWYYRYIQNEDYINLDYGMNSLFELYLRYLSDIREELRTSNFNSKELNKSCESLHKDFKLMKLSSIKLYEESREKEIKITQYKEFLDEIIMSSQISEIRNYMENKK